MASRIKNTKRNIIASYILMVIQILFSFISKSVIVSTLGKEYLGLSSLFSSILTVLNVAELGFTTSIVYFMYKPLAEHDIDKVSALLNYLRRVYKIVGSTILILGMLWLPFLKKVISGNIPDNINIYFLYIFYLLNTSISYFLYAHKTALLTAIQRLDLTKIANCVVIVIQYTLQLIALICFQNYYLFVIAMIVGTGLSNVFAAYISKKKYAEYICRGEISKEDRRIIRRKVRGLLICNISIVTYSTLDNIVISAFIGLTSVGIYSNYMTIYKAANQLIVMIRSAMQSSVGNSVATESVSKNLHDVYLWQLLFSIIATWCTTCMLCLYQPFMTIWMGKSMLLPRIDVILISIWFIADIVQQAQYLYLTATGMWYDLKYSYVFNTCCNLSLNIILGKMFGVTGVIVASLVTCIISGTFWQCIIIFKKYFKISARTYILTQFKYFGIAVIVVSITYFVCRIITVGGFMELIMKTFICIILPPVLLFVTYYQNEYFNNAKHLLYKIIKR